MRPGDSLLLGTDLVKDAERLVRAYDDSAGVTAQFNRNVLAVVNRELDADFDLTRSNTSRAGTRRRANRDVAAVQPVSAGARRRAGPRPSTSPRARRC